MAWQIDSTTILTKYGPYDLIRSGRPGESGRTNINAYSLIGGGTRTNISIVKKRWSFKLFNVSLTDAQAIEASIQSGEFSFYDEYDAAWYTVKCLAPFTGFSPLNRDKALFNASFVFEEA